jgi:ABC-type transporter Mla subunit MlaD
MNALRPSNPPRSSSATAPALESALTQVETGLGSLQSALQADDPAAVEHAAQDLQRALAQAVDHFRHAARSAGVPAALRQRLAQTSVRITVQREALARATASLDRAIDVLLPGQAPTYGAAAGPQRLAHGGALTA